MHFVRLHTKHSDGFIASVDNYLRPRIYVARKANSMKFTEDLARDGEPLVGSSRCR